MPNTLDHYREQFQTPEAYFRDNDAGLILYEEHAKDQPIIDVHTHADDERLATDRPYEHAWEVAGQGDHYVYAAMRAAGIDEQDITGGGSPKEKWRKLCAMMEVIGANPINFWMHHGLRTSLDVESAMNGITRKNADALWDEIQEKLALPDFSPRELLKRQGVVYLGTTDDPTSTLENHGILKGSGYEVEVVPTFRPDKIIGTLGKPEELGEYLDALSSAAGVETITDFAGLRDALAQRHEAFHEMGAGASDHGPDQMPREGYGGDRVAKSIFQKALDGDPIQPDEIKFFTGWLLGYTAEMNAEKGMVMQLHAGGLRNMSPKGFAELGPDTGFDASRHDLDMNGHWAFLKWAEEQGLFEKGLKVIPYPINTQDQETMASMARVFAGKVFPGSSWWFIDNKRGMDDQFEVLEGIIPITQSHPGMVSDTRSPITTSPRFGMQRLSLCDHTGKSLQRGLITPDQAIKQVRNISVENARRIFGVTDR